MQSGPDRLRVAVVGVGGVGGLVGALLSRQGHEVTFVATESSAPVLCSQGVRVSSERYGSFTVPATAVTKLLTPVDVCVFAVKATQLESAMDRVPAGSTEEALVVPILNGFEHVAALRDVYGARVVAGTIRVASSRTAPGVIEHASPFMKVELAVSDDEDLIRRRAVLNFGDYLQAAGVDVEIRESEVSMLWGKLIFLAPLALLTTKYGTTAGDVRTAHRDKLLALIQEVAAVASTTGAVVDADAAVQFFDSVPAAMQSSMQHDAAAGRAIEIEAIGGAILRAGVLSGVATPVTERFVEELRRIRPRSLQTT